MRIAKDIIKNFVKIHVISYKILHIIPICLSVALYLTTNIFPVREKIDYINILNTIGVLSAFFLFGMEKIDLVDMMKRFTVESRLTPKSQKIYKQGTRMVYTYYSLLLCEVFLIGIQYILYLFGYDSILLLFLSICYMLTAITFAILCWHGYLFIKN